MLKNTFYLGMALKATIFAGAVTGLAYSIPVLAEENDTSVIPAETETVDVEENVQGPEAELDTEEVSGKAEISVEESVTEAAASDKKASEEAIEGTKLEYQAHVAQVGWQAPVKEDQVAGTTGRSLAMEAIKMDVDSELEGSVQYKTYSSVTGWDKEWKQDNKMSGTTGLSRPIEAIQIQLTEELAKYYSIYYRTHVSDIGWMGWTHDGETAGVVGYDNRMEALQVSLIRKNIDKAPVSKEDPSKISKIQVQTHVANVGWQAPVQGGKVAGTTGMGLAMEAVKINLSDDIDGSIAYEAYVHGQGWQGEKKDWEMAGTTGQSRPIHALRISLEGKAADEYDIFYRAHVSNVGWMDWLSNGKMVGRQDYGYNIEALQVELRKKAAVSEEQISAYEQAMKDFMMSGPNNTIGTGKYVDLTQYGCPSRDEANKTLDKLLNDKSLNYATWTVSTDSKTGILKFSGRHSGNSFLSVIEDNYDALQKRIDQIIENADPNWSDLEKTVYAIDSIHLINSYNRNYNSTTKKYDHTIVGPFLKGQSVCQGYGNALRTLLTRLGVESHYVLIEDRAHEDVLIKIDGTDYFADITVDDSVVTGTFTENDLLGYAKIRLMSNAPFQRSRVYFSGSDGAYVTASYWIKDYKDNAWDGRYDGYNASYYSNTKWLSEYVPLQYYNGLWYAGGINPSMSDPSYAWAHQLSSVPDSGHLRVYQYNPNTKQMDMVGTQLPKGYWNPNYSGFYIYGDYGYTCLCGDIIQINMKTGQSKSVFDAGAVIREYYVDVDGTVHYRTSPFGTVRTKKIF